MTGRANDAPTRYRIGAVSLMQACLNGIAFESKRVEVRLALAPAEPPALKTHQREDLS
jgi:hypothetical protein